MYCIYEASLVVLCTLLGTSLAPGRTFHGMHVTDVKIRTLVQVTCTCLLTPEPFHSILDQVTASCDRYQTRTVAGKVTCSGAVAHQGVR